MINFLLLSTLAIVCLLLIIEGINKRNKVYQFPFFMGAIFASFILPQAFALVNNTNISSSYSVPEIAITRVLLMSCFCLIMCWIGYQLPIPQSWLMKKPIEIDCTRLKILTIFYIFLGILFWLLVFRSPGGTKLSGTSTGISTILIFFARLFANTGFALAIINFFKNKNQASSLFLLAFASIMPVYRAFWFGRRTGIAALILAIGIGLYLYRRYVPPTSIVITALILATILIPFLGEQRGLLSGKWNNLDQLEYTENIEEVIQGDTALELRNAALMIDAAASTGLYEWGQLYWNNLVFRYVPAQIVGRNFKNSLMLRRNNYGRFLRYKYNYTTPTGSTPTGIADSFTQFDYFGCFFFALMAILYKWLWYRALFQNSLMAQIVYMVICTYAMTAVTHATADFIPNILFALISLIPIVWFASAKKSYSRVSFN